MIWLQFYPIKISHKLLTGFVDKISFFNDDCIQRQTWASGSGRKSTSISSIHLFCRWENPSSEKINDFPTTTFLAGAEQGIEPRSSGSHFREIPFTCLPLYKCHKMSPPSPLHPLHPLSSSFLSLYWKENIRALTRNLHSLITINFSLYQTQLVKPNSRGIYTNYTDLPLGTIHRLVFHTLL